MDGMQISQVEIANASLAEPSRPRHLRRNLLLGAAGLAAVDGASLYGIQWYTSGRFHPLRMQISLISATSQAA